MCQSGLCANLSLPVPTPTLVFDCSVVFSVLSPDRLLCGTIVCMAQNIFCLYNVCKHTLTHSPPPVHCASINNGTHRHPMLGSILPYLYLSPDTTRLQCVCDALARLPARHRHQWPTTRVVHRGVRMVLVGGGHHQSWPICLVPFRLDVICFLFAILFSPSLYYIVFLAVQSPLQIYSIHRIMHHNDANILLTTPGARLSFQWHSFRLVSLDATRQKLN